MSFILKAVLTKLLTAKFLTKIFIHLAEYLVKRSENKLDDKLVAEIKAALD